MGGVNWVESEMIGRLLSVQASYIVCSLLYLRMLIGWHPTHTAMPCLPLPPQRRGGRACCGVTTGQLFCAMVGSQRRSEYTVFGNAINLRCVRACV